MTNIAWALGIVVVAILVGQWYPAVGGVIAMLPTKAIAYFVALSSNPDKMVIHAGVRGMLIATLCITVPFLLFLYWWTKP